MQLLLVHKEEGYEHAQKLHHTNHKDDTAGQGMNVRRVVYFASDQCNRYRPEISHTSLDLFRNYRAIPKNANSDRKTTNGQIHC